MSAFIVAVETIDRVVMAMRPNGSHAEQTRLGRQLLDMNVRAVCARYGSVEDANLAEPYNYTARVPRLAANAADDFVVLKALRCFLYQCSEGDVPQSTLFHVVSAAADVLVMRLAVAFGLGSEDGVYASELYYKADGWR